VEHTRIANHSSPIVQINTPMTYLFQKDIRVSTITPLEWIQTGDKISLNKTGQQCTSCPVLFL
jgi:hypothetical protein